MKNSYINQLIRTSYTDNSMHYFKQKVPLFHRYLSTSKSKDACWVDPPWWPTWLIIVGELWLRPSRLSDWSKAWTKSHVDEQTTALWSKFVFPFKTMIKMIMNNPSCRYHHCHCLNAQLLTVDHLHVIKGLAVVNEFSLVVDSNMSHTADGTQNSPVTAPQRISQHV